MAIIFERDGERAGSLDTNLVEPFTQRRFSELVNDSYVRRLNCVFGRVDSADREGALGQGAVHYYDARSLCKYVFELVISRDGRKVRAKALKDPLSDKDIRDIAFYELKPKSEGPLVAEWVGNAASFLESHGFRARIFNRNDPFDALSINFVFREPLGVKKKRWASLLVYLAVVALLVTVSLFIVRRGAAPPAA